MLPWVAIVTLECNVFGQETQASSATATATAGVASSSFPAVRPPSLYPPSENLVPLNAATAYDDALLLLPRFTDETQISDLLETPLERFSAADAKKLLKIYQPALAAAAVGARRDRCQWDSAALGQGMHGIFVTSKKMRYLVSLVVVEARVAIVERRFDDALTTLQIGFAIAAHAGAADASSVQAQMAVNLHLLLLDRVEELCRSADLPNLYWAVAAIPDPVVDLRQIMKSAVTWTRRGLPQERVFLALQGDAAEFAAMLNEMQDALGPNDGGEAALSGLVKANTAAARDWLPTHGYAADRIKAASDVQAVGAYFTASVRATEDENAKWVSLPYWQARVAEEASLATLNDAKSKPAHNPLLSLVLSPRTIHRQVARVGRKRALLMIREGLRAYAAEHGGALPKSLDELTETPAPVDPFSGRPFNYEVAGTTATIRSESLVGVDPKDHLVFTVTIDPSAATRPAGIDSK